MARISRASAVAAAKKIAAQSQEDVPVQAPKARRDAKRKRRETTPEDASDGYDDNADEASRASSPEVEPVVEVAKAKRRKIAPAWCADKDALYRRLFGRSDAQIPDACGPPERAHSVHYHRPLLLDGARGRAGRQSLLAWYDGVSTARGMPWRKPWVDPRACADAKEQAGEQAGGARAVLAKRAYEVWVSEIMAQQTRIAVVVGYWTRWMAQWPTMGDLAAAAADDVLAAWRGLGYYSRAARLHAGAKAVVADPQLRGLLPADVAALQARVPGVGRYTAGAIAAIVFGRPAAMVDGNVLRVLSRQLGVWADSKADKAVVDLLWAAAEALVQAVAGDGADAEASDRPGRWGQALMELGSTICGPQKPDCAACPISDTCRAYAEGVSMAAGESAPPLGDLEDACQLCEPFPEDISGSSSSSITGKKKTKPRKTKSPFFDSGLDKEALEVVVNHARQFPLRKPKKAVRELATLVCAIRAADGRYLLHRRPAKGLLAGLWELPSHDLAKSLKSETAHKEAAAVVEKLIGGCGAQKRARGQRYTDGGMDLGTVPWLFSHIRQTMHVFLFTADEDSGDLPTPEAGCWVTEKEAEDYSMGTGMRKCWHLVRKAARTLDEEGAPRVESPI